MGQTITIIRGTTNQFDIPLKTEDGAFYQLRDGEILRFGVKTCADSKEYKLMKEITGENINATGDAYVLNIRPEDTANLECRSYYYDVGLQAGREYYNVIPCSEFVVHHNITSRED